MDNLELKALFHCIAEHQETPVPWDWKAGVCYNLSDLFLEDFITSEQLNRIERLMLEWRGEGFSTYPVPYSPDAMYGRPEKWQNRDIECFMQHNGIHDMYTGTYGRSRREMCLYIARNI